MSNLPNPYRILGITNKNVGPFGLLGVSPDNCDRISVIRAMRSQLTRIDAHPDSNTPEANHLRQKIHIAANLLLDPDTLRELMTEYDQIPDTGSYNSGSASVSGSDTGYNKNNIQDPHTRHFQRSRPHHPPAIKNVSVSAELNSRLTGKIQRSINKATKSTSAHNNIVSGSETSKPGGTTSAASADLNNNINGKSTSTLSPEVRCLITNALVSAGGWNRQSRTHIVAIASMYSVTNSQLRSEIMNLAMGRSVLADNPALVSTLGVATDLKSPGREMMEPAVETGLALSSAGKVIMVPPPAGSPTQAVNPQEAELENEEKREEWLATRNLIVAGITFILGLILTIPFGIFVIIQIRDYSISKREQDRGTLVQSGNSATNNDGSQTADTASGITDASATGENNNDVENEAAPMLLTYSQALTDYKQQLSNTDSLDDSMLDRFRILISQGKLSWNNIDRNSQQKIQQFVVDVVYETGNRADDAQAIIDIVIPVTTPGLNGPNDIYSQVWSVGMLGVLMSETNLPARAASLIHERSVREFRTVEFTGGENSFNQAAEKSLVNLVDDMMVLLSDARINHVAMWKAWQTVAKTVIPESDKKDELICKTIQKLLITGPELAASEPTRMAMAVLLNDINWQTSANSRIFLLAWFDNPRISSEDLNVITSYIVSNSNITSLDETYILATAAASQARAAMRERYQQVWASVAGASEGLLSDSDINFWFTQTDKLIKNYVTDSDIDLQFVQLVMLARMNLAATLLESDKAKEALAIISESRRVISLAGVYDSSPGSSAASSVDVNNQATTYGQDGQWAILVAQAKQSNDRTLLVELIQSLANNSGTRNNDLGVIDATALAKLAIHGQSSTIRYEALQIIEQVFSRGPNTILTLADEIPIERHDSQLSAAVENIIGRDLPDSKLSDWYIAARFRLLEYVISLRGISGESAYINSMSRLLAETYQSGALTFSGSILPANAPNLSSASSETINNESSKMDPATEAYNCFDAWVQRAQLMQPIKPVPASLPVIIRRYATRSELADDPISQFAAAQLAVLEIITFVTAAERPDYAPELQQILTETTIARTVAHSKLQQLIAVEQAISQVWMIRLNRIQMKDLG